MSSHPLPMATMAASTSITGNDYASADIGHQSSRRKRAAVACSECRTRKVRCDVLGELPCVRCRIEGIPCTTPVRKRRATSPHKDTSMERLDTTRLDIPVNGGNIFLHELSTAPLSASRVHDFDAFNEPLVFCFDDPGLPLESMDVQPQGIPLFDDPWGTTNVTPRPASSQGTGPTSSSKTSSTRSKTHFTEDDMAYLTAKGVFEFPPLAIQDELVDAFFHHIQPLLPILNEKDFRDNFSAGNQSVQRALFRAVLFVATPYLKWTSVKQCGFSSVHEAQAIHFERAKLLYDVDTTTSPIERLQILLMFSYFVPKTEDQSHCGNKYWLGAATTIAKDLNLNKEETMARFDIKEARLLRRIWWACVGRDIFLAFTYRRAPSISPSDYNLAAITADDLIDDPHPSDAYQGLAKYVVARLYTHLTELAVLAHKHLYRRFSPGAGIKLELKNPSSLLAHLLDIGRGNTELAVWKQSFEGEDLNCLDLGEDTYRHLVMLRYTVLMGHNTIAIIANEPQPQIIELALGAWSGSIQILIQSSWEHMKTAALNTISSFKELVRLGLTKMLHISLSSMITCATIIELLELLLHQPSGNPMEDPSLRLCFYVLESMKDRFPVIVTVLHAVTASVEFLDSKNPSTTLDLGDSVIAQDDAPQMTKGKFLAIVRTVWNFDQAMANHGVIPDINLSAYGSLLTMPQERGSQYLEVI